MFSRARGLTARLAVVIHVVPASRAGRVPLQQILVPCPGGFGECSTSLSASDNSRSAASGADCTIAEASAHKANVTTANQSTTKSKRITKG
ncbi:hypothetical protein PF008_g25224 [Phytophthora fragariae]|uniref:Secreted protein n=1 Tax=Phytophthora fragariae TaxID=53985 RepID=A0A6G0QKL4_9STRA|nr:hypothetical protein PF008_g25224 [Phytophthora fragariae]